MMTNLAEGLARRGNHVDIVVIKANEEYALDTYPNCRVVGLGASSAPQALFRLARYLNSACPEVMISAKDRFNLLCMVANLLYRRKCVHVMTIHNTISRSQPRRLRDRLVLRAVRAAYSWADVLVAVSKGVADDLVEFTGIERSRVKVIYNPIVSDRLYDLSSVPLSDPWFASDSLPVVLGVGRLAPEKDFPTLIRAFGIVASKCAARLVILGDGPERYVLERLIDRLRLNDSVRILGFVENPYQYMARAHLIALSSRTEGLPTVLVEGMALGRKIVATDCPYGPAEILDNGRYGLLVPVGDAEELANAIVTALTCPEDQQRQAERRKKASQFEQLSVADHYLSLIQDLVKAD